MDMVFLQNGRIFPGTHKIGAATSGPRIADKNFTDTMIFVIFLSGKKKEHKHNCWVRISSRGVGVFHVNGWGPKSSVGPSIETQ